MTQKFELKTNQFAGPIEKLLELIEEKKLDITAISLSEVTADFLNYLRSLAETPPAILADFIVVAARLILIKSKALLPELPLTEEEEEDIKDLEARLLIYKEFKNAGENIALLWKKQNISWSRELFGNRHISVFYPPGDISADKLKNSLDSMLKALEVIQLREKSLARTAIVSVEEKIEELLGYLKGKEHSPFGELVKTREEAIVLFLAILHLLKDRLIDIEQSGNFYDIIIKPKRAGFTAKERAD